MQNDSVISAWRNGAPIAEGLANPAGPLFTEGFAAIEAAMTNPKSAENMASRTVITCAPPFGLHCYCN